MINVNFTYEGDNYNVSLVPREDYHFERVKFGDKEFTIRVSFTNNYITVYRVDEDESPFSTADNQIHVQKLKENKVRASKFLSWYLSDIEDFTKLGTLMSMLLCKHGKATITAVDLFNDCGYIPSDICEQKNDGIDGYLPSDLLFEDDLSKPNLTNEQKRYYYEREHTSI